MYYQDYYRDNDFFFHKSYDVIESTAIYGMHTHEMCEIYFPIRGNGRLFVEGNCYPLLADTIFLMRSNEAHHITLEPDSVYERMVLHFQPHAIATVDPRLTLLAPFTNRPLGQGNAYTLTQSSLTRIRSCFDDILRIESDSYQKRLAIQTSLFSILTELNRCFSSEPPAEGMAKNNRISEIISYINDHLTDELSVALLCDTFYISKSHLNKLFLQHTSSTVWKYVETKRLVNAKNLLKSGIPASEACELSGFDNYSTFFRAYKKLFGESPITDTMRG